jgi:hypothetical protein
MKRGFIILFSLSLLFNCDLTGKYTEGDAKYSGLFLNPRGTRTINVTTSTELVSALLNAQPGDTITLAPGNYTTTLNSETVNDGLGGTVTRSWFFKGSTNGTSSSKIILKSNDVSNPAVLKGNGWSQNGYILYLTGDYWEVRNIKIEDGGKGLIIDNANYCYIKDIEICNIGQEGLHVRDGSSYTTIEGVYLHDIGKLNDGYGEGIYVGSDNSVWKEGDGVNTGEQGKLYSREVHYTTIRNCTIGPNITAEPIDIKEGTTNTIVENCTIRGSGISGVNYADSHIDIKGCTARIRYNNFIQDNNLNIERSIMIVPRQNAGVPDMYTARDNYIHDNTFYLDKTDVEVVAANSGSVNTYAWNNTRIPSGNMYSGSITTSQPAGYDPGSGSNPPSSSNLKIQYKCSQTASSAKTIKPDILLINTDSSDINLAGYSIRYWFTRDNFTPTYSERYVSFGSSNADGVFGTANGMDYLQINLSGGIVQGNKSATIKVSIANTNSQYYNQSNDYSFDATYTSYKDYSKITLYKNGVLICGTEP